MHTVYGIGTGESKAETNLFLANQTFEMFLDAFEDECLRDTPFQFTMIETNNSAGAA